MEAGLFPPVIAHIVLILVGAISVVALVGIAYNYSIIIGNRGRMAKVDELEREVKSLQRELKELKERVNKYQLHEAAPIDKGVTPAAVNVATNKNEERNLKQEVWQKFVDDYNNLANSMNVPKAAEACENFVRTNKVHLLICVGHADAAAGDNGPMYAPVEKVEDSNYWAWNVPGQPEDFTVVPNPMAGYTEDLHHRGGMKETFASNYETGSFKQIQVKLPAHFTQRMGAWKIVQPGVIRVK